MDYQRIVDNLSQKLDTGSLLPRRKEDTMLAKKLAVSMMLALLFLSKPLWAQSFNLPDTMDSVAQLIVVGIDGRSPQVTGTAFFVGDGSLVATAAHVYWAMGSQINNQRGGIMFLQKVSLKGDHMFRVPVELIKTDDEHDVALFGLDRRAITAMWPDFKIKPLSLAKQVPEIGESTVFLGYFGSDQLPIGISGMIAGFSKVQVASGLIDDLIVDGMANAGQSGGPLISIKTGEVVGIMTISVPMVGVFAAGTTPAHSGVSRATSVQYLVRLMEASAVPK